MKKAIKKLSAVLLILSMMLSLSSCNAVDEMREHRAVWNGDRTVITYDGADYRYAPELNENDWYSFNAAETLTVSEEEVPLLLGEWLGSSVYLNSNGILIYSWDDPTKDDEVGDIYEGYSNNNGPYCYIREDAYDEVIDALENSVMDQYCTYDYVLLSDELKEEIRTMIADRSLRVDYEEYSAYDTWAIEDCVDIFACDELMLSTEHILNFDKMIDEPTGEEVVIAEYYGFDETVWYILEDSSLFDRLYDLDGGATEEETLF